MISVCLYHIMATRNSLEEEVFPLEAKQINYIHEKNWLKNYLGTTKNPYLGTGVKIAVLDTQVSPTKCDYYYEQKKDISKSLHADDIVDTIKNVSPNVILYCASIASPSGKIHEQEMISGVKWAIDQDVNIINMSLGFKHNIEEVEKLLKLANEKGIVMIAASGNNGEGFLEFPASSSYVIAVGALDSNGRRWTFSNYGEDLDFLLPGIFYSTEKELKEGTSFSTAILSGIVGRILDENPNFTPSNVYNKLIEMTGNQDKLNELEGYGIPKFEHQGG